MIRKIDDLGRIVIPVEIRKALLINAGADLMITISGENIFMAKYQPSFKVIQSIADLEVVVSHQLEITDWRKIEYDYLCETVKHLREAKKLVVKVKTLE